MAPKAIQAFRRDLRFAETLVPVKTITDQGKIYRRSGYGMFVTVRQFSDYDGAVV